MFDNMTIRFHPVSFNQSSDDVALHDRRLMFHSDYHCLLNVLVVVCCVCVPLHVSVNVLVSISAQVLGEKAEMRGGDGARNGQLQHLLLHSSSHFNLSVSASPSRRNVECVGESDLQLTLVVRKRMLAFTRCL